MADKSTKVIQYKKGDLRRLIVVIGAINELGEASLVEIERFTGHNKGTIPTDIEKIREQLGVNIVKNGAKYSVNNWGDLLKQKGIKKVLYG